MSERAKWFGWYARLYRWSMKALHAVGLHWRSRTPRHGYLMGEPNEPLTYQRWCHWCGDRITVTEEP